MQAADPTAAMRDSLTASRGFLYSRQIVTWHPGPLLALLGALHPAVQPAPDPVSPPSEAVHASAPAPTVRVEPVVAPAVMPVHRDPPGSAVNRALLDRRAKWLRKNQLGFGLTLGAGAAIGLVGLTLFIYRDLRCKITHNKEFQNHGRDVEIHPDGSCTIYDGYFGQLNRGEINLDPRGPGVVTALVVGAAVAIVGLTGTIVFTALRRDPLQQSRLTVTPGGIALRF